MLYGGRRAGKVLGLAAAWLIVDEFAMFEPPVLPIRPIEPWLAEARRIPRRMKRPFPVNKPHKPAAHRRPRY